MAKDTIRVGFIGAGGNTRSRHIPGLKAQAGVELAAVANRSVASGRKIAREFGIEKVCADWQEVLNDDSMLAASRRHPRLTAQIVPSPMTLPFDQTIIAMISGCFIGELIALDARIAAGSDFPNPNAPFHWRHDRTLSGNNIMSMGIWYEGMMRWVGPMKTVNAVGQSVINHRRDKSGRRQASTIPDHVDITGELELGGQMRLNVTTVAGLAAYPIDIHIFGSEGTLRLYQAPGGQTTLAAGKRGDQRLKDVKIPKSKQGVWRVEEEFINAIRGKEEITHTDFATAVKYMEWTDAVTMSLRHREVVKLPLMGN